MTRFANLSRYWRADRPHTHTVVFTLDDDEEPVAVACYGGLLCRSAAERRISVAFVSAVGAAHAHDLRWYERLHRRLVFAGLLR